MKKYGPVLLFFCAFSSARLVWGAPVWLVDPAEVAREAEYAIKHPDATSAKAINPDAPEIEVITPNDINHSLTSPLPIHLVFKPAEGAVVKPETFRALYGMLKIDITERIAKKAKVTPEGMSVENAEIPPGSHKLTLRVTDDQGRRGETELKFTVSE